MKYRIFISSVQREFAKERKAIAEYIRKDALFGKFFDVFLFEEMPASNVTAQKVYLAEAANCDVYLGLIGVRYGNEDGNGVSPTEREYDAAAKASRHILVFLKGGSSIVREDKEAAFLRKVESERVRRSFRTIRDLRETLAVSLVRFLEEQGKIQSVPFDMCVANDARLNDLSVKKMRDFVRTAREVRGFRLPVNVSAKDLLKHLNLIRADGGLTNAAILLFGKIVPTKHELPYDAVKEAIVNAICHRDYTSHQSVQVMLFADRLEVWNAGRLPKGLTVADLKKAHASLPPNELLALPMYLKGAIEKTGTGTEDMVKQCREWGLLDPEFTDGPDFRIVIRRRTAINPPVNPPVNPPGHNSSVYCLLGKSRFSDSGRF